MLQRDEILRPLFTIGMPVHNGMPYLPEAVESVLRQTYPHFELLIINDGSRDGSLQYLRSLKDARIRIISQEKRGLTATLNRVLEEISAPWLVRLDADDVCCPERLALIAESIAQHPAAAMFYSRARHVGHPGLFAAARVTEGTSGELHAITRAGYLLAIIHSSVALNVAKTRALGGYRYDLHIEDLDLWWRISLRHSVVFIPAVTVQYRLKHDGICINNIETLATNTLFAQYLLLSRLRGLQPGPYQQVSAALKTLVDRRRLTYREQMWRAAACVTGRHYLQAAPHLVRAAGYAPMQFFRRLHYPFRPATVRIGEDPRRFRCIERELWGEQLV